MKKITPNGTRTFCTSSPLGRMELEMISPIGSGEAAISPTRFGHVGDALRRQSQAVDGGIRKAMNGGCGDVQLVRFAQKRRWFQQQAGAVSRTIAASARR